MANTAYAYLPLARASAFNVKPRLLISLLIKAYYDGSGKSDANSRTRFLTLAGYAGTEDAWTFFEERWATVLTRWNQRPDVQPIKELHMADAHYLQGEFSRDRGWTPRKVKALLRDLYNEALSPTCYSFRRTFAGASCTVSLEGFRGALAERPGLPERYKDPESICTSVVVTRAFSLFVPEGQRQPLPDDAIVHLIFDENEDFLKTVKRVCDARKRERPFKNIKLITTGNSADLTPLQAADMIAWDAHLAYHHNDYLARFMLSVPFVRKVRHDYYDHARIGRMLDRAMSAEREAANG